jgi:hypothetical protein
MSPCLAISNCVMALPPKIIKPGFAESTEPLVLM